MTYLPTEEDLALLKSRSKRLYCRIELLNKDYQIIDMIEGLALNGSNSIDADSDTRRTFNLDIFPKKGFSISQFSTEEWTSKMLRLRIGMKAPTSEALIDESVIGPSEDKIESWIKNNTFYILKKAELKKTIWKYQSGGYAQYGNIDNINRQRIMWTEQNKATYAEFLEEQGESGTYSTVLGAVDEFETGKETKKVYQIAYTPMFVNADNTIIPLLKADIESYLETIFNTACDSVQKDTMTLPSKILELDAAGIDCTVYGDKIRVKNMIAAVEGCTLNGRTLTAADVAAISGCTEEELKTYYQVDTLVILCMTSKATCGN